MAGEGLICEFIVCEDVSGPAKNIPAWMAALLTCLRVAIRLHHEIMEPLRFSEAGGQEIDKDGLLSFRRLIFNILTEAETRGLVDQTNLLSAFDDHPQYRRRIEYIIARLPEIAADLGMDDEIAGQGHLITSRLRIKAQREELSDSEITKFRMGLKSLSLLNREFLSLACSCLGATFSMSNEDMARAGIADPALAASVSNQSEGHSGPSQGFDRPSRPVRRRRSRELSHSGR